MNNTGYNKFLVLISVIIFLSGAYLYFYDESKSEAVDSPTGSLSSSLDGSSLDSSVDNQISNDTAFLSSLSLLKKIKIDTSIFSNKSFNSLKDNNVLLEEVVAGRSNPFSPVDSNSLSSSSSLIVTGEPSQITSNSAVLSGSINSTIKSQSVYFEYGLTTNLDKVTSSTEQSLLGTFVTNVSLLTPKTTYYFRAVARVNNATLYGEVASFTTN